MPLVAIHPATQTRIESLDFSSGLEIRSKYPVKELRCPFCDGEVYPRDRQGFVLHFAHNKGGCSTQLGHHPESREHLRGKAYLAQLLKLALSGYSSAPVFLEYPLPEAGQHGRIADVAAVFPSGYILAYECQLASISVEEIQQRTIDYANAGVDVVWWLGGRANTPIIRDWCIQEFGFCYQLHSLTETPFVTQENNLTRQLQERINNPWKYVPKKASFLDLILATDSCNHHDQQANQVREESKKELEKLSNQISENGSHIISRAIKYTFYTWKRLKKEQIHRGLSIIPNSKGMQSVSGYLGALNNKAIEKSCNYWVLIDSVRLEEMLAKYRYFVPLSPQCAEAIKNRAFNRASHTSKLALQK
jgi:competence protein CoiA